MGMAARVRGLAAFLLAMAAGAAGFAIHVSIAAADDHVIETEMTLPATFRGGFGITMHADLDALIIRPDDQGRHPLALLNHGMTTEPGERHAMSVTDMRPQALEFVRRGWATLILMRRDYGKSGGHFAEDITGAYCGSLGFEDEGDAASEDLREAIRLVAGLPYLDMSRVISVGVSGGGFATVALTAHPPANLVAGISFAGGEGSSTEGMPCSFQELTQAFAHYGRKSRVPMLWVYAVNDHFFGPSLAKDFVAAFNGAGGHADFIAAPAFDDEGHYLFTEEGIPLWTRYVDDFLAKHDLAAAAPVNQAKMTP